LYSVICNADISVAEIRQFCKLDETGERLIRAAMGQMNLSAQGYNRVLKLAHDCKFSGKRTNPSGASGGSIAVPAKVDDRINQLIYSMERIRLSGSLLYAIFSK
jgi:hypothetical protein